MALVVLLAGLVPLLVPAGASGEVEEKPSAGVQQILADESERVPGGVVEGDRIVYPDGSYFVAVEVGTLSISQCDSGYFCGWAQSNYSGSFFAVSGSAVTKHLSWSTRSYRNRRSTTAKLFNNAGTASTCFAPNESRATIGSGYYTPAKVRLTVNASC